jgi:hypothetical protein
MLYTLGVQFADSSIAALGRVFQIDLARSSAWSLHCRKLASASHQFSSERKVPSSAFWNSIYSQGPSFLSGSF